METICFLNAPFPHIPAQRRVLQTVNIFIGLLDSFAGSKTGSGAGGRKEAGFVMGVIFSRVDQKLL